ncbi:hypothetical protein [Zobellella aerophila]|uniref:hypothetical protein n=1 Tax=Zobellella aerophila TaxID=870480 RepID=UPI0031EE39B9
MAAVLMAQQRQGSNPAITAAHHVSRGHPEYRLRVGQAGSRNHQSQALHREVR